MDEILVDYHEKEEPMVRVPTYLTIIMLVMVMTFAQSSPAESSTALLIDQGIEGWAGTHGEGNTAPKISLLRNNVGGTKAVKAEAISEGEWQGISLKLSKPVEIKKYRSISFWIWQGYVNNSTTELRLKSSSGSQEPICYTFKSEKREWTKVEIPLDPYSWSQANLVQNVTKINFADIDTMIWCPSGGVMRHPGQFIAIAGICFNPQMNESLKIPVAEYNHITPCDGDNGKSILTDGNVASDRQIMWSTYTNKPDIRFDLGGIYLINGVKAEAIGVPSQNISDIIVSVSMDNKEWKAVDSIINQDMSGSKKHQILQKTDMKAVGRYVRLQIERRSVDVPIVLSEVTFFGKLPTAEEMNSAALSHYDIGPVMPNVSEADYWILKKGQLSFYVYRKNGVISKFSDSGKIIAERIFNQYQFATKKGIIESDGYSDKVISQNWNGDVLCLEIHNTKLPELKFLKQFSISDNRLEEKITISSLNGNTQGILGLSEEVVLNKDYRGNGVYENWGGDSSNALERKFASEVSFKMGVSNDSALSFESVDRKSSLFHYLYSRNDKYTTLHWNVGSLSGKKTLQYTPTGWLAGLGLFDLNNNSQSSVESHLAVSKGTLLKAYDSYLKLPKVKEFYASINRPKWLGDLRCVPGIGPWDGLWVRNYELGLKYYSLLLREGYFVSVMWGLNFCWGEFPITGTVRNDFGQALKAEKLRDIIADIKVANPRMKILLYSWLWSANASSDVYKNHPEWFRPKDKNGNNKIFYPYWGQNYARMASIKASQDDMFDKIHAMVNFYNVDGWYLDGGGIADAVDEWNMLLDKPEGWYDLHSRLRDQLQKENSDRLVFFNNVANPLCDIGILESSDMMSNPSWRLAASWMWRFKLYQYKDPLRYTVYAYWYKNTEGIYEAYVAGLGMMPCFATRDIMPREVPYLTAQSEIRAASLADAYISPDWRYDEQSTLEAVPLKLGNAGLVFMRSHAKSDSRENVTVDSAGLGMVELQKPLYQWVFRVKDARKWNGRSSEGELEKTYKKTGWRLERIVTPDYLGVSKCDARISGKFDLATEQLTMWMMTQSPALVYSVDGLPTQYWLPETLNVKVSGEVKGERIILNAESGRKNAEIISIIPDGYYAKRVEIDGKSRQFRMFRDANNLFVVAPVVEGKHVITIYLVKNVIPSRNADFTISDVQPGKEMLLNVNLNHSWIGKPILVSIMKDGILNWVGSYAARKQSMNMKVLIPVDVEGGEYSISVSDVSGKMVCVKRITVTDGKSETVLPVRYVTLNTIEKVINVPDSVSSVIPVRRYGLQYSKGTCSVSVNSPKAKISVATSPVIESLWNVSAGGLEIKSQRYLKLRLSGNFAYFKKYGNFYQGHSVLAGEPNHFIGLILDYKGKNGYGVRTAAGLGAVSMIMTSNTPDKWGTGKKPDNIFYLTNFAYDEKDESVIWIDLKKLGAPDDWDGTLWLTGMLQLLHPDRQMNIEILATADKLPDGTIVTTGTNLLGALQEKKEYKVPSTDKPLTINGQMNEVAWKKAVKITGLTLLNNPGSLMSQETSCYVLHDAKNLYLCFEVHERETKSFQITSQDNPWENDSMEFCMNHADASGQMLHVIIDSAGIFRSFEHLNESKRPVNYPDKVIVKKKPGVFWAELSIPLEKLGINGDAVGKKIGFNIMRNRYATGSESATLVPGSSYFDSKRFYNLVLE